jgi:methionine-rich copper-binding protein CopC
MRVRPVLRRVAAVVAGSTIVLAGAPFVGSASAAAPVVAANGLSPADGAAVQPPATVSACFTTAISPTSTITLTKASVPVPGLSSLASCGTGSNNKLVFTPTSALTSGAFAVAATAADAALPIQTTAVNWSFTVDTTPPATPNTLTVTDPVNAANATAVSVTGKTDPNTAVSVAIKNTPTPGATASGTGTSNGSGDFTISGIDASALSDGAIRATFTATDGAGNTAIATKDAVKDTVAPARTTTVPSNGGTSQTRDTVVVTFTEALNTAASSLTVKNGANNTVGGATAFSNGNTTMTFTALSNFTPAGGTYTVSALATDVNGNASTTSSTFTIDNTAPGAPTVTLTDPVNNANKATAVVSGVAEPGSTVNVSVDDATPGSPVTGSGAANGTSGAYSVPVDLTALADGAVTATATATDGAGNTGLAGTSAPSTKDTVAPSAPSVTLADPVTNASKTTVAVSGVAEPGSAIAISVDDATPGSPVTKATTADGTTGEYATTVDLTPLADGTVTASVVATDAVGNASSAGTDTATKDTGVPAQPTLSVPTVNDTNKAAVPATGTAEPASVVTVTISDGVHAPLTMTPTAAGNGAYTTTFDLTGLDDGTLTATAVATDAAGNPSPERSISVTKDTGVPNAPAVVLPEYVNNATKGAVEISGTAEPATTIDITVTDTDGATPAVVTSVVTAPNGSWTKTVDLSSLTDGTLTASATATDAAGNTSGAGTDTTSKDVVKPAAPVVNLTNPVTPANAATSTVSGTAEAGSLVNVSVDDTDATTSPVTGSGTATGGSYTVPVDLTSLSDGSLTATATATDAAGNVSTPGTSAASAKDTVTLDVVSSSPANLSTVKPPATVSMTFNEPVNTSTSTIVVKDSTDSALAGATTFTNGNKTIVFTPADTLSDAGSPYTVAVSAHDTDGTDSLVAGVTFSVDGTPPGAPTLNLPTYVNNANKAAVPVSGVAEPGSTVDISVDDATVGSPVTKSVAADGGTGAYSTTMDLTSLADGALSASATATDAPGNVSAAGTDTATKDTAAPAMPTVNLPTYVNAANKAAVPVSGVADPGTSVALSVDDATPGSPVTATVPADATTGAYSTSLDLTSLADGTVTATAVASDAAANPSAAGTDTATKDTVVPGTPSITVSDPVNAANKTTVTVSGVAEPGSSVAITLDDSVAGDPLTSTKTADGGTGAYSATFDVTSLADGTLTGTAVATDAAGNASGTATDTATKDSTLPDAPVLSTPAEVTHQTYTAAPFSGTAEPGATVSLSIDDSDGTTSPVTGSTTADGGGAWSKSLDLSSLKDGTLTIDVVATDGAGNPSGTTSGSVVKNVTRAFTVAVSATPVSGAAQAVTVTAHQTYVTSSPTDTTYTGTPVLSSADTHFTAGTCGAAVAGVASCTGTVFGDLGAFSLSATQGSGDALVTGGSPVTVQPTGLVFSVAPPATASPGQNISFTVVPTVGVTGASIAGYAATPHLVTTGGSTPNTGTNLTCTNGVCPQTLSFATRGPKTIKVTDDGTPSLSTPTASVTIPYASALTLSRSRTTVNSGTYVTLSGKLTNSTLVTALSGKRIAIYRKVAPGTTYTPYTATTTRSDGTWAKSVLVTRNTTYQARYAGDASHLAVSSVGRLVKAAQVVTSAWTTSGRTVKVTGHVKPSATGRTIYLQYRKADGTWAYAGARATVTSTSAYTLSRTFAAGKYTLRVAIAATSLNAAGYSSRLGVTLT